MAALLNVRVLAVVFTTVVTLPEAVAVALALAPETTQTLALPQVFIMAAARFVASVDVVPLRTTHGAVEQMDAQV